MVDTERPVTDDIEFIVVECLDGRPCSRPITQQLSGEALDRVIHQLAEFQSKLSAFTFPSVGSLYAPSTSSPGHEMRDATFSVDPARSATVGPSVSLRFCDPTPPHFLGPFASSGERYIANIDLMLGQIAKSGTSLGHPAIVYLVHLWLREVVRSTLSLWVEEEIMLRHADDRGDHIFLDAEGNISGLIDWEW